MFPNLYWRGYNLRNVALFTLFVIFISLSDLYRNLFFPWTSPSRQILGGQRGPDEKAIVTASLRSDNTTWLYEHLPDWRKHVYVVDDPHANLTVPVNKGREAMAYLTYIIDNYADLPPITVFLHSLRYQWHNDDPLYDSVPLLHALNLAHVHAQGYLNLRCTWTLGCPIEMHPNLSPSKMSPTATTERAYRAAFTELLPNTRVPDAIGVPCCSQFAVTRDRIRRVPREDWLRWRRWLVETPLEDQISGRVWEYSWHSTFFVVVVERSERSSVRSSADFIDGIVIFGKPAIHCPNVKSCYCKTFGLCNLNCTINECEGRYKLPSTSVVPEGWPETEWL
ncbi:MAG: hypothetical protein M1833_001118 [Piccolia ochrophora]|nr:MAG: hypothetical protein M1833_001118 [Piccolia ochrophora]